MAASLARATTQTKPARRCAVARGQRQTEEEYLGALTKAFHELGYFEGKNIELDHRFPAEQPERFRALAQELAESKVDLIVAGTGLGAREAKRATSTIPILSPIRTQSVTDLSRVWRAPWWQRHRTFTDDH
jgi:hypothetical protein